MKTIPFSQSRLETTIILKTILNEGCDFRPELRSHLTPLEVTLFEKKDPKKILDMYYFDGNSVCFSHRVYVWRNGEKNQQIYDRDIGRLIEYGTVIQDMIKKYVIPSSLLFEPVVKNLRDNNFRQVIDTV